MSSSRGSSLWWSLPESQAVQVVSFLGPAEACHLQACASSGGGFRAAASSEDLWQELACSVFGRRAGGGASGPAAHRSDCGGWRGACRLWTEAYRDVGARVGCVPPAAVEVWQWLRQQLRQMAPAVAETLRRPVSEEDLHAARTYFGEACTAMPEVLGLWQVFDGQRAPMVKEPRSEVLRQPEWTDGMNWATGMLGGYAAYDHEASVVMLPLGDALRLTQFVRNVRGMESSCENKLAFACSYNQVKIFFVDATDASVHAWTRCDEPVWEPASPPGSGIFGWLREYARRLEEGVYESCLLRPESRLSSGICIMPAAGPDFARLVTNGVEVTASSAYMPEHDSGWTYRIAFRLVGTAAERGYETCQLKMRHWVIAEDGQEPEHVRGEGVIGLFPILADGGWLLSKESDPHRQYGRTPCKIDGPFAYQSCSGRSRSMKGSFRGEVTFVPGTIRKPTGAAFDVQVPEFHLRVPEYIY